MTELFIQVLNMSISACWVILAVIIARFVLRKAPKWIRVLLWGIVAVRLLCPFSFESAVSLIPSAETISTEILLDVTPTLETGVQALNQVINPILSGSSTPEPGASVNPLQITFGLAAVIWILGIVVMLIYAAVSYFLLGRSVRTAVPVESNIFQCETISSPFVLGIIHPRIYLPFTIKEQSIVHVITHERAHIRRKDHWWKPIGYVLLTVHWFNPLMWLGYILLCRDIELACDEKVIKDLGTEERADYSAALLTCSINRRILSACPVAFGEVSVKTRVKTVLRYKTPAFWIVAAAVIISCVLTVCFLTDPISTSLEPDLSFLNYKNAVSLVSNREEIQTIYCPPSQNTSDAMINVGTVDGRNLATYLDACEWRITDKPKHALASPGSIEFVIEEACRIQVYERKGISLRGYAVVTSGEGKRYYSTAYSDYQDAVDLLYADEGNPQESLWEVTRNGDSYYLTVGCEGVTEIEVVTPNSSGGCINADGTPFHLGEVVWLEQLEDVKNPEAVRIQASDAQGNILYIASLPVDETEYHLDSTTAEYRTEQSVILSADRWIDGIVFENLKPNEEILSDYEIVLTQEQSTVEFSITWERTGLTLEYGIRSADGTETMVRDAGGSGMTTYGCIPAGTYRLFVRNTDYTGVPAYENPQDFPDVDFNATGVLNFKIK